MATENEMTVTEMEPLTATELRANDPTGINTLLYVIRGLGADRDRYMKVSEILEYLAAAFTAFYIKGANTQSALTENGLKVSTLMGTAGAEIKPSLLKLFSNAFKIQAENAGLTFEGNGVKFSVGDAGVKYENGDYTVILSSRGLKFMDGETVVFEIDDGVITTDKLKADNVEGDAFKVGNVVYATPFVNVLTDETWGDASKWEIGQVKRLYAGGLDSTLTLYRLDRSTFTVNLTTNVYRELLCIGFVSVINEAGESSTHPAFIVNASRT